MGTQDTITTNQQPQASANWHKIQGLENNQFKKSFSRVNFLVIANLEIGFLNEYNPDIWIATFSNAAKAEFTRGKSM